MQRGRVPCHSECSSTRHCAHLLIYMPLLSLEHPECTSFMGIATIFSSSFCTESNTSCSPAQDYSHQKRVISNPAKSYQTFCLQTKCLKICSSFGRIAYNEERPFGDIGVSPFSSCWQIVLVQSLQWSMWRNPFIFTKVNSGCSCQNEMASFISCNRFIHF